MAPEDAPRRPRRRGRNAEAPPAPEPEEATAVPVEPANGRAEAEAEAAAEPKAEAPAAEAAAEPEAEAPEAEAAAEPEKGAPEVEAAAEPEKGAPAAEVAAEPEAEAPEAEVPAEPEPEAPEAEVPAEPEAEAPAAEAAAQPEKAPAEPAPPPVVEPVPTPVPTPVPPPIAPPVPRPTPAPEAPAAEAAPEPEPEAPAAEAAPAPGPEPEPGWLYERWWATGLPNVGAVARRELGSLFVSPIGYVVAIVVMGVVGWAGFVAPVISGEAVLMDTTFNWLTILMAIFIPIYTMRLLAEERRSGTLEILLTSPVRDWELVLGKWLAGFTFFLATIAFTLVFVVLLSVFQPLRTTVSLVGVQLSLPAVDYGAIAAGYVGVILLGAAWVAIGLLASSLTSNQIIAAVLGIAVLLAFQLLFDLAGGALSTPVGDLLDYLSAFNRFQPFNQGQIFVRDVVYFLSLTVAALFVTTRVVESRKWR